MAEPISAACGAWDDLWGAGFPDPVLGETGNGTHLLYPVDLPNDSDIICPLAKRPKKSSALGGVRHNVPLMPHIQLLLRFGRFHWLFLHIGMVNVVF